MEVLVVAGELATGVHYALTLCRAKELRQVPETEGGKQIVARVHVVVAGELSRRLRKRDLQAGEPLVVDGYKLQDSGALRVHHAEDLDQEGPSWPKKCQPVLVMPRPWELARWVTWTREHAKGGTVVCCMHAGMDHVARTVDVFDEKSKMLVLFGAPYYAATLRAGDDAVCAASLGALLLARVPRKHQHLAVQTQALEAPGTHNLWYCDDTYRNNWLFGAFMWRLYDAYAALVFDPARPRSLHEQLCADAGLHRRALLALFDEAQAVIPAKERSLIEFVGSPLAVSLYSTRLMLRMPDPLFAALQHLATLLTLTGFVNSHRGAHFGDVGDLRAAPFYNGFVVDQVKKLPADLGTSEAAFNAFITAKAAEAYKTIEEDGSPTRLAAADIEPHLRSTKLFSLPMALCMLLGAFCAVFVLVPAFAAIALNILLPNEAKFL